jgi:hypothetical protein
MNPFLCMQVREIIGVSEVDETGNREQKKTCSCVNHRESSSPSYDSHCFHALHLKQEYRADLTLNSPAAVSPAGSYLVVNNRVGVALSSNFRVADNPGGVRTSGASQ